jgi:hypothetical protein
MCLFIITEGMQCHAKIAVQVRIIGMMLQQTLVELQCPLRFTVLQQDCRQQVEGQRVVRILLQGAIAQGCRTLQIPSQVVPVRLFRKRQLPRVACSFGATTTFEFFAAAAGARRVLTDRTHFANPVMKSSSIITVKCSRAENRFHAKDSCNSVEKSPKLHSANCRDIAHVDICAIGIIGANKHDVFRWS